MHFDLNSNVPTPAHFAFFILFKEFEMNEGYGEPLVEGQYKVRHDIYDLDGEVVINKDDTIDFKTATDNILGYDVFKYQDVYLTTEDLYV